MLRNKPGPRDSCPRPYKPVAHQWGWAPPALSDDLRGCPAPGRAGSTWPERHPTSSNSSADERMFCLRPHFPWFQPSDGILGLPQLRKTAHVDGLPERIRHREKWEELGQRAWGTVLARRPLWPRGQPLAGSGPSDHTAQGPCTDTEPLSLRKRKGCLRSTLDEPEDITKVPGEPGVWRHRRAGRGAELVLQDENAPLMAVVMFVQHRECASCRKAPHLKMA